MIQIFAFYIYLLTIRFVVINEVMLNCEVLFLGVVDDSRVPVSLGPHYSRFPLEFYGQRVDLTVFGQLQRHLARNCVPVGEGAGLIYGVAGYF